jgi:hypothetical protein
MRFRGMSGEVRLDAVDVLWLYFDCSGLVALHDDSGWSDADQS